MKKVISMLHLSLDGLTSGPNDELDWISYDSELERYAHSMHDEMDTVIWGRRTYEGMAGYWLNVPNDPNAEAPALEHARWLDTVTKVVVSRTLDKVEWNNTSTLLIKDNLAEEINKLKHQAGKNMWLLGSPVLTQSFMQLDLIDEYRFNINPTVLGVGKALFDNVTRQFPLKLLECNTLKSGVITLRYEPVRG